MNNRKARCIRFKIESVRRNGVDSSSTGRYGASRVCGIMGVLCYGCVSARGVVSWEWHMIFRESFSAVCGAAGVAGDIRGGACHFLSTRHSRMEILKDVRRHGRVRGRAGREHAGSQLSPAGSSFNSWFEVVQLEVACVVEPDCTCSIIGTVHKLALARAQRMYRQPPRSTCPVHLHRVNLELQRSTASTRQRGRVGPSQ